jgi:predicted DNA-binding protein
VEDPDLAEHRYHDEVEQKLFGTKSVRITVTVTERQRDGLRRISEKTGVSVSQYVREALERVLDLAERQMRSIERALEKDES